MKPLNLTTTKANSVKVMDFSSLIKEMKDYWSTKTTLLPTLSESMVQKTNKLEYIFAQPNSTGKSLKEEKLNDFLNNEGIFQINTSVVIKELKFTK